MFFASRPVPVQSRQSRQAAAEEEERKQRPWSPEDSEEKRAVVVSALGGRTEMPGGDKQNNALTSRCAHNFAPSAVGAEKICAVRSSSRGFSRIIFRALSGRSFVLGIYCIAFCLRRVFRLAFPCAALFVSSERAHVPRDASDLRLEGDTHHAKFFFLSSLVGSGEECPGLGR